MQFESDQELASTELFFIDLALLKTDSRTNFGCVLGNVRSYVRRGRGDVRVGRRGQRRSSCAQT